MFTTVNVNTNEVGIHSFIHVQAIHSRHPIGHEI